MEVEGCSQPGGDNHPHKTDLENTVERNEQQLPTGEEALEFLEGYHAELTQKLKEVEDEVAALVEGDPRQFTENVGELRSRFQDYDKAEERARELGYSSVAEALEAVREEQLAGRLVRLPDFALRAPKSWTTTHGFSEEVSDKFLRRTHEVLENLLEAAPDYFDTLSAEALDGWSEAFTVEHPRQFLQLAYKESDRLHGLT